MKIRDQVVYSVGFENAEYDDDKYVKVVAATIEEAFQKVKETFPERVISHLYVHSSGMFSNDNSKPPRWTVVV